jgi:hypothetical protein
MPNGRISVKEMPLQGLSLHDVCSSTLRGKDDDEFSRRLSGSLV